MSRDDLEGLLSAVGRYVHDRHFERPAAKVNDLSRWFGDDASDSSAIAAAVGSLMTRITSNPAIAPARIVSARWKCVKYAGTLMTP